MMIKRRTRRKLLVLGVVLLLAFGVIVAGSNAGPRWANPPKCAWWAWWC